MELAPGIHRLESVLWESSSTILVTGGEALLIDPGILPAEVERVREYVDDIGARVASVVLTHGDWDHVAGLWAFPDARVWTGPLTAERIAVGEVDRELRGAVAEYGVSDSARARVDAVLTPGEAARVGSFTVETMTLPGHTADVIGIRVRALGVLAVGDYVSAYESPWIKFSSAAYRSTLASLTATLRDDPVDIVVPGHGRAHTAAEALAILAEDSAYLRAIHESLRTALAAGASRDEAEAQALDVRAPRGDDGGEAEDALRENVGRHLTELTAC